MSDEQFYKCGFCGGSQRVEVRYRIGLEPACRECYEDAPCVPASKIPRYRIGYFTGQGHESAAAHPHDDGEFVTYIDHLATIATLTAERDALRGDVQAAIDTIKQNQANPTDKYVEQRTMYLLDRLTTALAQLKEQPNER